MKYCYQSKTIAELEGLAKDVLKRFATRIKGCRVDIEGVLEDMGVSMLPRPGIQKLTAIEAYLPRHPDFMVIDEEYGSDLPYYRLVIAEEISHRVIEPELWRQGVPKGANIYEIDKQMYDDIEGDAYRMALALLMPPDHFADRFRFHLTETLKKSKGLNSHNDVINHCVIAIANDFEVTFNAVVSRGKLTGLFKGEIRRKELPGAVVF